MRHCHHFDPWVDAEMTVVVLDAIDDFEPAWHDAVDREDRRRRSNRPRLARHCWPSTPPTSGGEDALWSLDAEPLPR